MTRIQSHPFTLIELILSFGLGVGLLTTLFSLHLLFYRQHQAAHKFSEGCTETLYCFQRLQTLFEKIPPKKHTNNASMNHWFYTTTDSLVFTYDHGPDLFPEFSGEVLGEIIVDTQGNLNLLSWSLTRTTHDGFGVSPTSSYTVDSPHTYEQYGTKDSSHLVKQEKLLENITDLSFQFLQPTHSSLWTPTWSQKTTTFPLIVKLECKKKTTQTPLCFKIELSPQHHHLEYQ